MTNSAAAASAISGPVPPGIPDGMQTLRAELDLARASQLTLLRLQLALHKSNRRAAMQALDDLLDIDAEMEGLAATLGAAPARRAGDAALFGFIEQQKAAIATEKHVLTGGDPRGVVAPVVALAPDDGASRVDLPVAPLVLDEVESDEPGGGRTWVYVLAAAIFLIVLACGLIAYLWPALLDTVASGLAFRSSYL